MFFAKNPSQTLSGKRNCLFVCLLVGWFVCLFVCLFVCFFVCLFVCLVCLFVCFVVYIRLAVGRNQPGQEDQISVSLHVLEIYLTCLTLTSGCPVVASRIGWVLSSYPSGPDAGADQTGGQRSCDNTAEFELLSGLV